MLVDDMMQFLLYHGEDTTENFHLLSRKMKCLGTVVTEKLIAAHLLCQRGAVEQVGMKHQGSELYERDIGSTLHSHYLTGSKTRHRHLVEVVGRTAIR